MTDDKKKEIEVLAAIFHGKKIIYDNLGAANTYGLTPEQRLEQHQAYEVAYAEVLEAQANLRAAQTPTNVATDGSAVVK